jgi:hypothetical protein
MIGSSIDQQIGLNKFRASFTISRRCAKYRRPSSISQIAQAKHAPRQTDIRMKKNA